MLSTLNPRGSSRLAGSLVVAATARRSISNVVATHITHQRATERPVDNTLISPNKYGVNVDLNWSLVDMNITPENKSFRNLSVPELAKFSYGAVSSANDFAKLVTVNHADFQNTSVPVYIVDEKSETGIARSEYNKLRRDVRDYLSHIPVVVVHDGAVGSSRAVEQRVRVVTDNSVTGLFFRNLLVQTPLGHPEHFKAPITVYHAPAADLKNLSSYGIRSQSFVALNQLKREIVAVGNVNHTQILDLLARVGVYSAAANNISTAVVAGDCVVSSGPVLLLNSAAAYGTVEGLQCVFCAAPSPASVYASRYVGLNPSGHVTRLFEGAVTGMAGNALKDAVLSKTSGLQIHPYFEELKKKRTVAVLEEKFAEGSSNLSFSIRGSHANELPAPRRVIIFTNEDVTANASSKISIDDATKLVSPVAPAFPTNVNSADVFRQALTESKSEIVAFNVKKGTKADLKGLLSL